MQKVLFCFGLVLYSKPDSKEHAEHRNQQNKQPWLTPYVSCTRYCGELHSGENRACLCHVSSLFAGVTNELSLKLDIWYSVLFVNKVFDFSASDY